MNMMHTLQLRGPGSSASFQHVARAQRGGVCAPNAYLTLGVTLAKGDANDHWGFKLRNLTQSVDITDEYLTSTAAITAGVPLALPITSREVAKGDVIALVGTKTGSAADITGTNIATDVDIV